MGELSGKRGTLINEAYGRIKELIAQNYLVPGQKLRYEDLSKKLNMGTTPIIQALNKLETFGLLMYDPNKGYSVGEATSVEASNLYHALAALSTYIIPSIIKNINSDNIDKIIQKYSNRNYGEMSRREIMLDDIQFHLELCKFGNNDVIYNLIQGIYERIYLKYRPENVTDVRIKEILREHGKYLGYLRAGHEDKAVDWVGTHLMTGMQYMIHTIKLEKPGF